VKQWIGQLVGEGLLDQTADEFPVLKLNDESWQVMRGRREVRLTRAGAATASRKSRVEEVSWEGVNTNIFDALRTWRREVASEKGMAPFTIFHDGTLRDISRIRPTTIDRLHLISGVGEVKLRDYGQTVLDIVARMSQDLRLSTDNPDSPLPVPPTRAIPSTAELAYPHFRAGKSIAEVARLLGRAESTISEYLSAYIQVERPGRIDTWVDRKLQDRIRVAASQHGSQRLKPVFLALNQEVPYDAIKIVLAHLNACPEPDQLSKSLDESLDKRKQFG
jgi:ATP-dependent DNA helicase RecQ